MSAGETPGRGVCPVRLEDMLAAREARAKAQQFLLAGWWGCLVSFTLNLAGEVKSGCRAAAAFDSGLSALLSALGAAGIRYEPPFLRRLFTGDEAYLLCESAPEPVKRIAEGIERDHPAGRLFDLDVLDGRGRKLSRTELGLGERRCFVCGRPAFECARSRRHSAAELAEKLDKLLEPFG